LNFWAWLLAFWRFWIFKSSNQKSMFLLMARSRMGAQKEFSADFWETNLSPI
jgi:hypothetical protein